MKNVFGTLLLFLLLPAGAQAQNGKLNIPDWVLQTPETPGIIYGIGYGSARDRDMALSMAQMEARNRLANALSVEVATRQQKLLSAVRTKQGRDSVTTSFRDANRAATSMTMSARTVEQQITSVDGTSFDAFVLMETEAPVLLRGPETLPPVSVAKNWKDKPPTDTPARIYVTGTGAAPSLESAMAQAELNARGLLAQRLNTEITFLEERLLGAAGKYTQTLAAAADHSLAASKIVRRDIAVDKGVFQVTVLAELDRELARATALNKIVADTAMYARYQSVSVMRLDSTLRALEAQRRQTVNEKDRLRFGEQFAPVSAQLADAIEAQVSGPESVDRAKFWLMIAAREWGRTRELLTRLGVASGSHPWLTDDLATQAQKLAQAFERPGLAVLSYAADDQHMTYLLATASGRYVVRSEVSSLPQMVAGLRRELRVESTAFGLPAGSIAMNDSAAMRTTFQGSSSFGIDKQSCMAADSLRLSGLRAANAADTARTARDPGVAGRAGRSGSDGGYTYLLGLASVLLPCRLAEQLAHDQVEELIIVPSGKLNLVPFAALPLPNGELLGIAYRLRYAPSFTALLEIESRGHAASASGDALVVGNPSMPRLSKDTEFLSALPGAAAEGAAVAERLGAVLLTGAAASESAIRPRLSAARVIHLATHGYAYASPAQARASFIALAPGNGEDGLLTVGEIMDDARRLQAELVVLSACQTALGNLTMVEGTIGLPWAFLSRGARSVVVSLWNVDDATTRLFMDRFYTHWTAGAGKAEALRRAQEEVRKDHPSPRLWAAFQLIGAN